MKAIEERGQGGKEETVNAIELFWKKEVPQE